MSSVSSNSFIGTIVSSSGSTWELYNTTDQTTNFERLRIYWSSNTARISTELGGTGTARDLLLSATLPSLRFKAVASVNGNIQLDAGSDSLVGGRGLSYTYSSTAASGNATGLSITHTLNQSGTSGYIGLTIDCVETATGSGTTKLIANFARGGVTQASIDRTGLITTGSATMIASSVAFTNGAAANVGTLTNAPAVGNPTKWIPINDNGTTRFIPAW